MCSVGCVAGEGDVGAKATIERARVSACGYDRSGESSAVTPGKDRLLGETYYTSEQCTSTLTIKAVARPMALAG